MITVSPLAAEKLSAYLAENNINSAVRIMVSNGCGGSSLGMALDERKAEDHVLEEDNFMLLLAPDLAGECGRITVDFVEKTSGCGCGGEGGGGGGFSITSEKPLPNAGGGCGGSCGSGGCG